MTATALPQTQTAIIARVRASATIPPLITGVFDAVPQGQPYPYVVYDEATETHNRTFAQDGHIIVATLSIYTSDAAPTKPGRGTSGYLQGLTIANALAAELTDLDEPLVVDDHDVVDVDVDAIDAAREDDSATRRIDLTLIVTLEDAPC